MLNFCPYEIEPDDSAFKKIDLENLAYEVFFIDGFSFEDLKDTALVKLYNDREDIDPNVTHTIRKNGGALKVGKDPRLKAFYNDEGTHYMLYEKLLTEPKSGIQRFMEYLEQGNEDIRNGEELIALNCIEQSGTYIISYAEGSGMPTRNIMVVVPCCPSCHQKLPSGWQFAEDFCGISLLAPRGGGKTTFLVSMLVRDLECFQDIDPEWIISAAHSKQDGTFMKMKESADKLYDERECPDPTDTEHSIAPVFLKVNYRGHFLMVGIYDNSGEVLSSMNNTLARIRLLPHMDSHIYMIEPEDMNIDLAEEKVQADEEGAAKLLTLEEQGKLQKVRRNDKVRANELLVSVRSEKRKNPLAMYNAMRTMMNNAMQLEKLQSQHICCTIIKCDKLEELDEFKEKDLSQALFQRGPVDMEGELLDETRKSLRQKMLDEEVFSKYVFSTTKQKHSFIGSVKSVSWHCVSALGCETENYAPNKYRLVGAYDPIRLEEPILACVVKKVEENGWYETEE